MRECAQVFGRACRAVGAVSLGDAWVNALGSFAIGLFGALAARFGWSEGVRLALTVGLCGGFTTFSTFSREALDLVTAGRWCAFSLYVAGSVILGIAAAALGFACARCSG